MERGRACCASLCDDRFVNRRIAYGRHTDRTTKSSSPPRARPKRPTGRPPASPSSTSKRIERLGEPLVPAFLRLVPSAAVSTSGPAGSLTEVRIRGAEANHTLLFIDGIRANDPPPAIRRGSSCSTPTSSSRIEVVRGPQSALWGSEAIGGVIAVDGDRRRRLALGGAEGGSFGFRRASLGIARTGDGQMRGGIGWQRATGIDIFDGRRQGRISQPVGPVARDLELAPSVESVWRPSPDRAKRVRRLRPRPPFQHTDTLDSSRNRLAAGRLWARFGAADDRPGAAARRIPLGSTNRNFLAGDDSTTRAGPARTSTRSSSTASHRRRRRTG